MKKKSSIVRNKSKKRLKKRRRKKRRKRRKRKKGYFTKRKFFFNLNPSYNIHGSMKNDPETIRAFLQDNICTNSRGNSQCRVIEPSPNDLLTEDFKITGSSPLGAINVGYYFSRKLSTQLQYSFFGKEELDFKFIATNTPSNKNEIYKVTNEFSAIELNLRYHMWLSKRMNLFISPGANRWSIRRKEKSKLYVAPNEASELTTESDFSGFSYQISLGADYHFNKRLFVGTKTTFYPKIGDEDSGYQSHLSIFLKMGSLF